ncbi:hypothetical protein CLOSTMETH_02596 [[Clostridium] methylpentosum DSM 5476]|uniref:Uncharacterized protein n=1 Tax=[Clostridium] methylpentosum DSM 5476 TaxID=537013 RepID=C0EFF4_9FIRM|nr:hypothetical protein CLOSTMETH_02596 [[Clostridium] methylpentosum DSM 5476]
MSPKATDALKSESLDYFACLPTRRQAVFRTLLGVIDEINCIDNRHETL